LFEKRTNVTVEELAFGPETKNPGRSEAISFREAEALPIQSAGVTWIASVRLDESM
jgi:hypothetical protein